MALWVELNCRFQTAYAGTTPDDALVDAVYAYAEWCMRARRNAAAEHDPCTAATVAFYEHIPTIPAARQDMPRWLRPTDVVKLRDAFTYLIGNQEYDALLRFAPVPLSAFLN
jgi:hypothetical protein